MLMSLLLDFDDLLDCLLKISDRSRNFFRRVIEERFMCPPRFSLCSSVIKIMFPVVVVVLAFKGINLGPPLFLNSHYRMYFYIYHFFYRSLTVTKWSLTIRNTKTLTKMADLCTTSVSLTFSPTTHLSLRRPKRGPFRKQHHLSSKTSNQSRTASVTRL